MPVMRQVLRKMRAVWLIAQRAHQDGAHDFWRKVGETDEDCQIVASHSQPVLSH